MTVHAIVLAAGQSRRFGSDKRRVRMPDGDLLVNAMLRRLSKAGIAATLALPPDDDLPLSSVGRPGIICPDASQGMGCTIASSVAELAQRDSISALMIMPVDLPLIRVSTLRAVAERACTDRIVVPSHDGRWGHPVCFGRDFFALLSKLEGEQGGKCIIKTQQHRLILVRVADPGIYEDGDDPDIMAALLARLTPKSRCQD